MRVGVMDGGVEAFNSMIDSNYDNRVMDFIQSGYQRFANTLANGAETFMNRANTLYENYNGLATIQRAKALLYNVSNIGDNSIRYLDESGIYNPNDVMKRYMMVNPMLYDLNQNQMCNAYGGMYLDVDPCAMSAETHVDYTRVMDGMTVYDGIEENDDRLDLIYYADSTNQTELHHIEKCAILDSWRTAHELMNRDLDPTSLEGDEL